MKFTNLILGLTDETGELATALTEKYLSSAEMGNLQSMTPGMTDVIFSQS
jgi:NTP pyrophosphatase (non-canonical NTP hydrolase)